VINGSICQKITQDGRSAGFDGVVLVGEREGGLEMDGGHINLKQV